MMYTDGKIHDIVIKKLQKYTDQRGWLIELFRQDEVGQNFMPVMSYVSQTDPGIARGPHEHVDQADFFFFIGPSTFKVYMWDARKDSPTYKNKLTILAGEDHPVSIIVPRGIVHAYKNIGAKPGLVYNAPNRLYAGWGKKEAVDEIRHEDLADSPFVLD